MLVSIKGYMHLNLGGIWEVRFKFTCLPKTIFRTYTNHPFFKLIIKIGYFWYISYVAFLLLKYESFE